MTSTESTGSAGTTNPSVVVFFLLVGLVVGIAATLLYQNYWPRALGDGEYTLALPHDGALAVKDPSNGKSNFYVVPPEAVNYVVDPTHPWTVRVTARGLYRLVTVTVPTDDYLPKGSVRQPTAPAVDNSNEETTAPGGTR